MDALVSMLTEALEKAKYSRDANAALLSQYAGVVAAMLKQFHDYKQKHIADVAAWHRSYRAQLAEARAENSRLREQIWEMQERAGCANEWLRRFRRCYDDDAARWERRVDARAARQELRFWKRLAMPDVPDDDASFWSDDDDLVDPFEKIRLADMEKKAAQDQLAGSSSGVGADQLGSIIDSGDEGEPAPPLQQHDISQQQQQQQQHHLQPIRAQVVAIMGGVAMQREDSAGMAGLPTPPPRPSSAASSTGRRGAYRAMARHDGTALTFFPSSVVLPIVFSFFLTIRSIVHVMGHPGDCGVGVCKTG